MALLDPPSHDKPMRSNPGFCPEEARGKRVWARLAHGGIGAADNRSDTPPGWAADGRNGCRWVKVGGPFDIEEYEVIA
jgi:hypothetical protein